MTDDKTRNLAFALAGLGGFNAHGAGVLKAADDTGTMPDLITATSGQIVAVADWLGGVDLEAALIDDRLEHDPLAQLRVAVSGDPGVFRPAYAEAWQRWWTPPSPGEDPAKAWLDRLLPAQIYVPARPPSAFVTMAEALNGARRGGRDIGVVFNAYDVRAGTGVLFGNDRARALWDVTRRIPLATQSVGAVHQRRPRREASLHPITPDAVEAALWLSLYGFDTRRGPLIDGAYHRSCIVAELHGFDRIVVARPLAEGWRGTPPRNALEVQDWQTEMWFSVGYKAEVETIHQINGLVAAHQLGAPFREVTLHEIAPATPAGFFNYFIERHSIFAEAREQATSYFNGLRDGSSHDDEAPPAA